MAGKPTSMREWVDIIRCEYYELPGLRLTKAQAQRLWGLDSLTCDTLLDLLVESHFLKLTPNGSYARVDLGA